MSAPTTSPARAARPGRSTDWADVSLVAGREIRMRLRSTAFLVSTGILMLAVLASVVVGGVLSRTAGDSTTPVAVVGSAQEALGDVAGLG
jgi:ABC-2 type transport system permease protein